MSEYPDYEPLQPERRDWRETIKRAFGPLIAGALALAKFTFVIAKAGSIFIAVGLYALFFGWWYAVGIVLLILLHELGHYLEALREGLHPRLPVFIPFLGAYVQYTRGNPWQTARVAIAGRQQGSDLLLALAYFGFFLNLFNLIPVGIFDGGAVWRSARWLRVGGGPTKAMVVYALYFGTALALVVGMIASHVPRNRV